MNSFWIIYQIINKDLNRVAVVLQKCDVLKSYFYLNR